MSIEHIYDWTDIAKARRDVPPAIKSGVSVGEAFYTYTVELQRWKERKVVPISEARLRRGDRL